MTNPGVLSFLMLGMTSDFTFQVIDTLHQHQIHPLAVILYGQQVQQQFSGLDIEVAQPLPPTLQHLNKNNIPVYYRTTGKLSDVLKQYEPDILLTACWPALLPEEVLGSARCAALNIHPSLLPKYRGANPLQDQWETADHRFGVTLHQMNDRYDAGEIIKLKEIEADVVVTVDNGLKQVEQQCAICGADLFIEVLKGNILAED